MRPPLELAPGVVVGGVIADKYRVNGVIGKGGMGVVVAATQLALERTVAIKVIRSEWTEDAQAVARLLREARAAASIKSEHVARVLDVGTLDSGAPFIVMEHLEGVDLDTLLTRGGPLPVSEAIDYILQACEAIAEAHRNGIVHRDLKPANLFVARLPGGASTIKVVDFGISKSIGSPALESLTDPSRVVGSLYHMAPEQMRGLPVDARTDVWAIGVILFELITGRKPFLEGAWPAVCAQVLNEQAPPLGVIGPRVPAELDLVVQRCLRRASSERFANVAELAVALSAFGSHGARASLEQIVRLATSTGSLAADTVIPRTLAPGTREISSVEPIADPLPVESSRLEPTVVAASPPRLATKPERPNAPRDRRWRVLVTAAVAATALALWLAPETELPAPVEPRTTVERLAPESARAPEPARAPLPEPAAPTVAAPAAASASAAEPISAVTTASSTPAASAVSSVSPTADTPPPASSAPAASTPRAPAATGTSPAASAPAPAPASPPAATTASTALPTPSAEASALGEPTVTSTPAKPAPASAWDLSDIEFKELPE